MLFHSLSSSSSTTTTTTTTITTTNQGRGPHADGGRPTVSNRAQKAKNRHHASGGLVMTRLQSGVLLEGHGDFFSALNLYYYCIFLMLACVLLN
jgi:hypothetical protein